MALATRGKIIEEAFAAYVGNNTLDPTAVWKFVAPMIIPPAMPLSRGSNRNKDKFDIGVRQFDQQILPAGQFGRTRVWSYGSRDYPSTFNYPAFTIEATHGKDAQVQWSNELVDGLGNPLPHLLPVDPTLHWANPIGLRDTRPSPADGAYWGHPYLSGQNGSYVGPVPMVTHVHGAHTGEESDGYPEAWYLPAVSAGDPLIASAVGTYFDIYNARYGAGWKPGRVSFRYPNTQRATTLWYHDHTLGMTRLNVYAGPAGFYLVRGGPDDVVLDSAGGAAILPGPAPGVGANPFGSGFYEIPIVVQDRAFDQNGQLWYPYYRAFFEGLGDLPELLHVPFIPGGTLDGGVSDVSPIWQPEFFGNVMVVNGVSWPYLDVERRRYRFRLLNGCNSRFLLLDFNGIPNVRVWQIGADGGFLPAPVDVTATGNRLLMAPAERADVIVDFGATPSGDYVLANLGPDEPFGGGEPPSDFDAADSATTGQVMQFRVRPAIGTDASTPPERLVLPAIAPLVPTATRYVSLNEEESKATFVPIDAEGDFVFDTGGTLWEVSAGEMPAETAPGSGVWVLARLPGVTWASGWTPGPMGPTAALLGTLDAGGAGVPMLWMAPVTENPGAGTTEMWVIHNFTMDAHPIHIHLVQFQVVGRYAPDGVTLISGPEPGETGFKDTVIAYPDQVTKVQATFDTPGRFVWHCHIVEHEDNEMMRPYDVV